MEGKKDCKMYVSESVEHGCRGLKRLLCKIGTKPCKFYKPDPTRAEAETTEK